MLTVLTKRGEGALSSDSEQASAASNDLELAFERPERIITARPTHPPHQLTQSPWVCLLGSPW
jgi:hypothetical protein